MNNFDESKHPRNNDGKFAKKEQAGAVSNEDTNAKKAITSSKKEVMEYKTEVVKIKDNSSNSSNSNSNSNNSSNSNVNKEYSNKIRNAPKGTELHALTHNYKKTLERYSTWSDGTYDLETGKSISYDTGFQVSFQQTSDSYSQEEYNEIVYKLADTTESMPHVGVFKKDPEISFHCLDEGKVMKIMKEYNQHSAVAWKRLQEWNSNPKLQEEDFDDYCLIRNPYYDESKNKINKKEEKK